MSEKTKNVLWGILLSFIIFIINGASVAWLVLHFIPLQIPNFGEISYWDILSSKALYQLIIDKIGYLSWLPEYHWYNTLLVYVFMILGFVFTFFIIKALYNHKQRKKDRELQQEANNNQKSMNDKLTKIIDKISKE